MATFDPFDIRTLQEASAGAPAVQNALSRLLTGFGVPADVVNRLFGEGGGPAALRGGLVGAREENDPVFQSFTSDQRDQFQRAGMAPDANFLNRKLAELDQRIQSRPAEFLGALFGGPAAFAALVEAVQRRRVEANPPPLPGRRPTSTIGRDGRENFMQTRTGRVPIPPRDPRRDPRRQNDRGDRRSRSASTRRETTSRPGGIGGV